MASRTLTINEMDAIHEGNQTTWVSDWVINLNLSPQAIRLYVQMCRAAKDDESNGTRVTLSREQADDYAQGDGEAAVQELLKVEAITKISRFSSGKTRFQLQDYSPEIRALRSGATQADNNPVVTYG
jgi:hypothetical protein